MTFNASRHILYKERPWLQIFLRAVFFPLHQAVPEKLKCKRVVGLAAHASDAYSRIAYE
jgi:hypothetical protein